MMFNLNFLEVYASILACVGTFMGGVDLTFPAALVGQAGNLTITVHEQSLIGSLNLYGRAASSLFIGYYINVIGRKNSLLLVLFLNSFSWFLMSFFSQSLWIIYMSRVISGLSTGMRTPTTMYISEIAGKGRRGFLMSFLGLSVACGVCVTYAIQYFSTWIMVAYISLAISVAGLIQMFFLTDSKYWYLYKGNVHAARESIKWFDSSLTEDEISAEIKGILSANGQTKSKNTSCLDIFKNPSNARCFILGSFIFLFFLGSGRTPISSHPDNYYSKFSLTVSTSTFTFYEGIIQMIFSFLNVALSDRVSRKGILHSSCWLMNACLLIPFFDEFITTSMGISGEWMVTLSLILYFGFSSFLLSICTTIIAEITSCSTEARGLIQSFLYFLSSLIAAIYTQIFPFLLEIVSVKFVLLFFFFNLVFESVLMNFIPENRGKVLHECNAQKENKSSCQKENKIPV